MSDIFENQTVKFEFTITDQDGAIVDISAATLTVVFETPAGASTTKTAALTTDGTDGKMEYTAPKDEINESGPWEIQGVAVIGAECYPATIEKFMVTKGLPRKT